MGTFLKMMGNGSSQPKLKKYRVMKTYTADQMKQWLYSNCKIDEIVELCAYLILDELNDEAPSPITITQEEFEKHFRIRKPQLNPNRKKRLDSEDSI